MIEKNKRYIFNIIIDDCKTNKLYNSYLGKECTVIAIDYRRCYACNIKFDDGRSFYCYESELIEIHKNDLPEDLFEI